MARPATLSILIPTYSRARWLEALLRALARDRATSSSRVDILVSDNCSPDHTAAMVGMVAREFPSVNLELVTQPENLGSIGNIKWLLRHGQGDYLWVFGDDDEPAPGAVGYVLELLDQVAPAVLHLPHRFQPWPGARVTESPVPKEVEVLASSRELLLETHHWLSFLTASVVKREAMAHALDLVPDTDNPWGPHIWFSVAALHERCAIAPRMLVTGGGEVSWSSQKQEYFTTRIIDAFDDGFHLAVDAAEYGRLLDHRYEVDWAVNWDHAPIDELRAAVERFPTSRLLRWKLAERRRGTNDRSVMELVRACVCDSGDVAGAAELTAEGEAAFMDGDFRAAARKLNKALVTDPTSAVAWCDLGVVLSAMHRFEAITAFDRALELEPDHIDSLLNRADWALSRGLPSQAAHDAERVLALEPDNERAAEVLAQTGRLGEPADAR